jgi:hypothetical protein
MSYLRYLCLLAYNGVQHILCLLAYNDVQHLLCLLAYNGVQHILCLLAYNGVQHILCCVFLRIVHIVLPVSLDCPFLIVPSVFSNVYLYTVCISCESK